MASLSRRGILRCLGGLIAAPAIVKFDSIMPVKSIVLDDPHFIYNYEWVEMSLGYSITYEAINQHWNAIKSAAGVIRSDNRKFFESYRSVPRQWERLFEA